ncbi:MAG: DUF4062 domain-containing protein [Alcanivoracaceae bacterium]|nr:DUF4062 domain-containing protein [Alcanivoracaceae bacterium]
MNTKNDRKPRNYAGVMVSSTYKDLEKHRSILLDVLIKQQVHGIGMEHYVVDASDDVVSSSLKMVDDCSAYIALISHRYGFIPDNKEINPNQVSITRLEYEKAQKLNIPTLVFVMSDEHDVKKADVETNEENIRKLKEFSDDAKQGRIYVSFDSIDDFTKKAIHAVASLSQKIYAQKTTKSEVIITTKKSKASELIPKPPKLYAQPEYLGSHRFIGRQAQLDTLNDWANAADTHSILSFEAIGGSGKSILTWEWVKNMAATTRTDWAGIFWYSFYEKGGVMADFCAYALAYMTEQPLGNYQQLKAPALSKLLLAQLKEKPWLIVCDGLERILVSYHRMDAAQLRDEDAGNTDAMGDRDPCSCIRPFDDDLLRALSQVAPSKILITSRLVPRVLLNAANQPVPGVLKERLPGLKPNDAEQLFRSCGVIGDSNAMQIYLRQHCDCHPLVTGVLAGLISFYMPDRGNFDKWSKDPNEGGQLNLAKLDLVKKRNHIIQSAIDDLDSKSQQLLSILALLSEAVDSSTLNALNPHLPDGTKAEEAQQNAEAMQKLQQTVKKLEAYGLLQYDQYNQRYDLHPVVRGVSVGMLALGQKQKYGQKVVDHFSDKAHIPYKEAKTKDDLVVGLNLMRTLLQMENYDQAYDVFQDDLAGVLRDNLGDDTEVLNLLQPFFNKGWNNMPISSLQKNKRSSLRNDTANSLNNIANYKDSYSLLKKVLQSQIEDNNYLSVSIALNNISISFSMQKKLAKAVIYNNLAIEIVVDLDNKSWLYWYRTIRYLYLVSMGSWTESEQLFKEQMNSYRVGYNIRPGRIEFYNARHHYYRHTLTEEHLKKVELIAGQHNQYAVKNDITNLRGDWYYQKKQYQKAMDCFNEVIRRKNEVGSNANYEEIKLSLAKHQLNELVSPHEEAQRLSKTSDNYLGLARLWVAIGDNKKAGKYALAAYKQAWSDGEPYVFRYSLNQATAILKKLQVAIPQLAPYDKCKKKIESWEQEVFVALEKLKAVKKEEK